MDRSCGTAFSTAQPVAVVRVTAASAALTAGSAATMAIYNSIFPGVATATVITRLNDLVTQLGVMATPAGKQCHNTCDGKCSRPGYNGGQGPAAVMTLCPDFLDTFTLNDRVEMLMHEGMHATPGSPVVDRAYRSQRLIDTLSGGQAETNTDNYVSLILRLQAGAPATLPGGPPADTTGTMTAAEATTARQALAFMEKWVEIAEWDTSQLYDAIRANIGRAGGWDPASEYHADTQHRIGWLLGLTDPGPAAPRATAPTHEDQVKVAGIHDRYQRMSSAVAFRVIAMDKGAAEAWAPNAGPSVVVSPAFFGLTPMDRVVSLMVLLETSMPDIPAGLRTAYAQAANQIRWHKGIGP